MNLAIWLKKNGFRADQVQTFYPSPMATPRPCTTGRNTLAGHPPRRAKPSAWTWCVAKSAAACTRPFCATTTPNWPLLREALKAMGRADLIGNGKHHLIPTWASPGNIRRPDCPKCSIHGDCPARTFPKKGQGCMIRSVDTTHLVCVNARAFAWLAGSPVSARGQGCGHFSRGLQTESAP
jgi:hypothetical protein